jgi:hypothetical protein
LKNCWHFGRLRYWRAVCTLGVEKEERSKGKRVGFGNEMSQAQAPFTPIGERFC